MTLTLIALAVSSIAHAETTTVATLDVKGGIQIYGATVLDAMGVMTPVTNGIDLAEYDADANRIDGYQYFEGEQDGRHYTMTFAYDADDKFASQVDTTDGNQTWKGEWYDRTDLGFTSKMTSGWDDSNNTTECITESMYTVDISSWPSITNLGEKLSSIDRLTYDRTRTCTTTDITGESEPVVNIEEFVDEKLTEVYHRTVLMKTSYDVNGFTSDDCIVVLREAMWGNQVRTYCMDLGLVEMKMVNNGDLYQRVSELSSPSLQGDK